MTLGPFTDVAKMLANGNDPKRLAVALAEYARLIGIRRLTMDDNEDDKHLLTAARILRRSYRTMCKITWAYQRPITSTQFSLPCQN